MHTLVLQDGQIVKRGGLTATIVRDEKTGVVSLMVTVPLSPDALKGKAEVIIGCFTADAGKPTPPSPTPATAHVDPFAGGNE